MVFLRKPKRRIPTPAKRRSSKELATDPNLNAGYVPVDESLLHAAGLRGASSVCLFVILAVLWLIALTTLALNVCILRVAHIGHRGASWVQLMALDHDETLVQFTAKQHVIDTIVPKSGVIGGYKRQNLVIDGSPVELRVVDRSFYRAGARVSPSILFGNDSAIKITGVKTFSIVNSDGGTVFDSASPSFRLSEGARRFTSQQINAAQLFAHLDHPLTINASASLLLDAKDGVFLDGKYLNMRVRQGIGVNVGDGGSVVLDGQTGTFLPDALPVSTSPDMSADVLAYRVCACLNGRLFAVDGHKPCAMSQERCTT